MSQKEQQTSEVPDRGGAVATGGVARELTGSRARCECRCGYRCGGPGRCSLGVWECLAATDGQHFVHDCDHDLDGPEYQSADGCVSSSTCSKCGEVSLYHDMRVGP